MKKLFWLLNITFLFAGTSLCSAGYFATLPAGTIKNMNLKYKDGSSITISSGYCEANKSYFELIEDFDYSLANIPSSEDFIYIYIDFDISESSTPEFTDSTTEPIWQNTKQGWYNGNDRCIGVVWTAAGSSSLSPFNGHSDNSYIYHTSLRHYNQSELTYDWTYQELTDSSTYLPVNAIKVIMNGYSEANSDTAANVILLSAGDYIRDDSWRIARAYGWIKLFKNGERRLYYMLRGGAGHEVEIKGYEIDR